MVLQEDPERYLIVVNAANIEKDWDWFSTKGGHASGAQSFSQDGVQLENASDRIALLAIQGPKSRTLVSKLFGVDLDTISYYHFVKFDSPFGGILLSETGYTGEEGFEIFCPAKNVLALWNHLMKVGKPFGLKPIGFGARDTLRLESRFLLYGHDMTDETTPLEAGLGWTVGWEKDNFSGKQALEDQRKNGIKHKLVGFELIERGIAREGCAVSIDQKKIGQVTSGTFSPTLKKNIGLAYLAVQYAQVGQVIDIEIRGELRKAKIVKTPFYKREKPSLR